ncbi:hypothetical protein HYT25_00675 [Candidatus Pacearchaeota archaeon]|nr:hypothetical protein [Candidatus Pacearchaeota archaeon]
MGIKNLVGDLLGYGRCPVTNDTYWHADIVSVPYSENSGVLISARALNDVPKEKIADIVFRMGQRNRTIKNRYSIEQIANQIPKECRRLTTGL